MTALLLVLGTRDRIVISQLRFSAVQSFVSNNFGCKHEWFFSSRSSQKQTFPFLVSFIMGKLNSLLWKKNLICCYSLRDRSYTLAPEDNTYILRSGLGWYLVKCLSCSVLALHSLQPATALRRQ